MQKQDSDLLLSLIKYGGSALLTLVGIILGFILSLSVGQAKLTEQVATLTEKVSNIEKCSVRVSYKFPESEKFLTEKVPQSAILPEPVKPKQR